MRNTANGPGSENAAQTRGQSDYATPLCFASGTLIATDRGLVPVEDLEIGDLVMTADDGLQPLRWIARTRVSAARLTNEAAFRPIRIKAGAFGPDRPARDLRLSPNHRVLLTGWRAELMFGMEQVLVSAKSLVNGSTIVVDYSDEPFSYHHLMFDRHQIVFSEGMPTESFLPGVASLATIPDEALEELFRFFPELRMGPQNYGISARPILTPPAPGTFDPALAA